MTLEQVSKESLGALSAALMRLSSIMFPASFVSKSTDGLLNAGMAAVSSICHHFLVQKKLQCSQQMQE